MKFLNFVGSPTKLSTTKKLLKTIYSTNSHIRLQIHFFVSSQKKFKDIQKELGLNKYLNCETFLHINRDNHSNFDANFKTENKTYFGLDIKDIIDELFPWEQFVKKQLIVCLQSKKHKDRAQNLNRGLKLIYYSTKYQPVITLDRSVDDKVTLNLEEASLINIVCGSYLKENIDERYKLLKKYLNDKKK